jgi:L-ascorbate metabolism protein UlaG (beta-lactamase superfamily)
MKYTYYGHACFSVEVAGKTLLFDPFISHNDLAKHIDIQQLKADYILLSHGHFDHVADAEQIAQNTGAKIISNYEIVSWYEAKGIKGHPMNFGGQWQFDFGTVHYVQAVHSSVLPDGTHGGNPGGFVIETAEGTFYYAGDTALTMDMKLIPMLYPKLLFAVLPIGDNFTMNYKHAAIAADFIECSLVIGCHYDTFGYIKLDHAAAQAHFAASGKTLQLPGIGASLEF